MFWIRSYIWYYLRLDEMWKGKEAEQCDCVKLSHCQLGVQKNLAGSNTEATKRAKDIVCCARVILKVCRGVELSS